MPTRAKRHGGWFRRIVLFILAFCIGLYLLCLTALAALRWIDPPTTMVQVQRRLEASLEHKPYRKRQVWMPLGRIAPDLQHAVISAEDGRFFQHHGIDWKEVQKVVDQDLDEGRVGRGGSTITQQLVKNLFFTTRRSFLRKAIEFTLAPTAEWFLSKQRILELYLNVVEWGPGVYGAEAAAQSWYGVPAARLTRDQSARLAAILPSPLRRKPARMNTYSEEILRRMAQTGY
ncbi:MAG TPA: monofunctional biosynthetic peptidoglycan transglycosylase [Candidatus Acidoferrales bacterium]|nr:monofunctional biosynthetic peptidoglycan transglycosylase [Candidatus Acidoferrales bacterium]